MWCTPFHGTMHSVRCTTYRQTLCSVGGQGSYGVGCDLVVVLLLRKKASDHSLRFLRMNEDFAQFESLLKFTSYIHELR